MASLPNKYAAILDALDYAADVDQPPGQHQHHVRDRARVRNKLGSRTGEGVLSPVGGARQSSRRRTRESRAATARRSGMALPRADGARRSTLRGSTSCHQLVPQPGHEAARHLLPRARCVKERSPSFSTSRRSEPFPYGMSTFAARVQLRQAAPDADVGREAVAAPTQRRRSSTAGRRRAQGQGARTSRARPASPRCRRSGHSAAHRAGRNGIPYRRHAPGPPAAVTDRSAVASASVQPTRSTRSSNDAHHRETNRHMADPLYFDRGGTFHSPSDVDSAAAVSATGRPPIMTTSWPPPSPPTDPQREKLLPRRRRRSTRTRSGQLPDHYSQVLRDRRDGLCKTYGDNVNRENVAQQPARRPGPDPCSGSARH